MPEPLVSLSSWKAVARARAAQRGLHLSIDGKISQRSYIATVRMMMARDKPHLKEFTAARPAQPVFGIDHASISNARDFTHGGVSLGALYRPGSACTSELKMSTCVIGQMNDNMEGLKKMLAPQEAFETEGGLKMPATIA